MEKSSVKWVPGMRRWSGKLLGFYSQSGWTSYHQISWCLKAASLCVKIVYSLWNLTDASTALLSTRLSNFRAIGQFYTLISRLRDFVRCGGKTSVRLENDVNRGPGFNNTMVLCKLLSYHRDHIWVLCCQKQISRAGKSNYISQEIGM